MQFLIKSLVRVCLISAAFLIGSSLMAQDLNVGRKNKTYWQQVQADSLQLMVELKTLIPGIVYDLRYATKNNFTKEKLYKRGDMTFLRAQPALALQKIEQELRSKRLGLKIFDAYRPYSVTKKMWDLIKDERYVANPSKGSGHNRGLAIDLTIINLNTGQELDMGTGFDHFSDTAHQDFTSLPEAVLENRKMMKEIMEKFGFKALSTEWWHYSWPNDRNYAVLDIDFKKLRSK